MAKKKTTTKNSGAASKAAPTKKDDSIKKIGSIPLGYNEDDIVFIKDNKIFIKKK